MNVAPHSIWRKKCKKEQLKREPSNFIWFPSIWFNPPMQNRLRPSTDPERKKEKKKQTSWNESTHFMMCRHCTRVCACVRSRRALLGPVFHRGNALPCIASHWSVRRHVFFFFLQTQGRNFATVRRSTGMQRHTTAYQREENSFRRVCLVLAPPFPLLPACAWYRSGQGL